MNLRGYYQKIRETAAELEPGDVWVESLATPDGGKAGVFTQVPRQLAAKLIVDGKAKLAKTEVAEASEARRAAMQPPEPGVERVVVKLASDTVTRGEKAEESKAKKPRG